MKTVPMSEFRRTAGQLAKAGETVTVTINGYPIATYTPTMSSIDDRAVADIPLGEPVLPVHVEASLRTIGKGYGLTDPEVDAIVAGRPVSSTFRPAPKPARKKR